MGIAKIKRIEIIGLETDKDALLKRLQRLGAMELIPAKEIPSVPAYSQSPDTANLAEIEDIISLLASFHKKKSAFGGMLSIKEVVDQKDAQAIANTFDYQSLLKEANHLRDSLKNFDQHQERLIQEAHLLAPWKHLHIPLDELCPTHNCGIFLGVLDKRDHEVLISNCQEIAINVFCDVVYKDRANVYLFILYLKQDLEKLESLLKQHRFNFVTLSRHKATVKERILQINRKVMVLDGQSREVKNKIAQLSGQQKSLMVVYDYLDNVRRRRALDKEIDKQKFTFRVSGWLRKKDIKLVEEKVLEEFPEAAIFVSEPEGQNLPVILENPRWLQPFEFITRIYGMPKYHELDPTPFLAPFFFLYFGFCVSDAGYGFLIVLISWITLKKFPMGPQGWRFFRLFLYCGISTIVVGLLTGSLFGNALDIASQSSAVFLPLKKFKDSLVILDPMQDPTRLLVIALWLGIVQIWFGNIVGGMGNFKNKRYLDILLDQVPMLTFLFGLTGLGMGFLGALGTRSTEMFKYAALLGALVLILTQGRSEKDIGSKIFFGFYNLYSALSGYLSDILSYSRLWALGLVTGVMANTINLISVQFSQIFPSIFPFVGKVSFLKTIVSALILIIVFIAGHLVAFLMNLLGAFVHPLRLQFVEFFSKFFKSGGQTFKPFKVETKYININ
jgi:V/A-type H+-transporting ATPase subunit I